MTVIRAQQNQGIKGENWVLIQKSNCINLKWGMSWGIHSFGIAKNVLFPNIQLSAELFFKWKYSYLPPQFPRRESEFGEFCAVWSGLKWGSMWSSYGITLNYRLQLKMEPLHCGLWSPDLVKGKIKEEEGEKKVALVSALSPPVPSQNFEPL